MHWRNTVDLRVFWRCWDRIIIIKKSPKMCSSPSQASMWMTSPLFVAALSYWIDMFVSFGFLPNRLNQSAATGALRGAETKSCLRGQIRMKQTSIIILMTLNAASVKPALFALGVQSVGGSLTGWLNPNFTHWIKIYSKSVFIL